MLCQLDISTGTLHGHLINIIEPTTEFWVFHSQTCFPPCVRSTAYLVNSCVTQPVWVQRQGFLFLIFFLEISERLKESYFSNEMQTSPGSKWSLIRVKMAQEVKVLVTTPNDLSSTAGTRRVKGGDDWLLMFIHGPPHARPVLYVDK